MWPGFCKKRCTYKLTGGKQNPWLTRRSLDEKIVIIDGWLKMTSCRILEYKQVHTNDNKSNNPLSHHTEKSVAVVYYSILKSLNPQRVLTSIVILVI